MIQPVADGSGNDACRPVGGGGNDLTSGGILFVHRHRIGRHPVVDRVWRGEIAAAFGLQCVMDTLGAAAHIEPTGQDAIGGKAAFDTIVHHFPDAGDAAIEIGAWHPAQLVCTLHLGDGFTRTQGHFEHFGGGFERVGHGRAVILIFAGFQLFSGQDEAATDGIVGHFGDHVALGVGAANDEAVRVAG